MTLLELLIAAAALSAALGAVIPLVLRSQDAARARPEAADQLQRLRVAVAMLRRDLLLAGAGPADEAEVARLADAFPPILPYRAGARGADPALSFFTDRITLVYATPGRSAAVLAAATPTPSADLMLDTSRPGCPAAGVCGFVAGQRAVVADVSALGAGHDLFTVTAAGPGLAHGSPDPPLSRLYPAGTPVVPLEQRVYYFDPATRRLMLYDGYQSDLPLVDDVVGVEFGYWVAASGEGVRRPEEGSANCAWDPGPVSRLADYGGLAPVRADAGLFADGPLCGIAPNEFDADLLRIRRVQVRVRVQVSADVLRGRGSLFARPGQSPGGFAQVADLAATVDVRPRNLP